LLCWSLSESCSLSVSSIASSLSPKCLVRAFVAVPKPSSQNPDGLGVLLVPPPRPPLHCKQKHGLALLVHKLLSSSKSLSEPCGFVSTWKSASLCQGEAGVPVRLYQEELGAGRVSPGRADGKTRRF